MDSGIAKYSIYYCLTKMPQCGAPWNAKPVPLGWLIPLKRDMRLDLESR